MGTTNLDDVCKGAGFFPQRGFQLVQFGDQMLFHRHDRRHVHGGREDVIGALAFVDVIVRVHFTRHAPFAAEQLTGTIGQHFVHVHVALGA